MPPRGRRAAAPTDLSDTLVIGIIGRGDLGVDAEDDREIRAVLDDLFATKGIKKAEVIFAMTDEAMDEGAWKAWEYVADNLSNDLSIAGVVKKDGNGDDEALEGSLDEAKGRKVTVNGDDLAAVVVVDELIKAKNAGADARLVVFLVTDEDPDVDTGGQYVACESAVQAGIKAYDITNAMDTIDFGTPEPEAAPEPEPEPEAPKRPRGRPRKAEAEPTAEAPVAEEEKPPTRTRGRTKAAAPAGEAQETVSAALNGSDAAIGSLIDLLAEIVANKVVEKLNSK